MWGFGLKLCLTLARFFLRCHSLTRNSSGTACYPSFDWPSYCRPPKSSNNDHTIVARLSPKPSSTFGSSPHGLGSGLDAYCNTIVYTTFWRLQRVGTCSLWQQRSCAFGYCSLAAGYYWCMVIVIIFEYPFGIKISIYNTLLGYYPLLDQPPNHIINYEPLSLEKRCKEWAQIMQRM